MTTIAELRKIKKQWMKDTLSESQLKKDLKLTTKDIRMIKFETQYGKTRYQKNEVSWYLKLKKRDYV